MATAPQAAMDMPPEAANPYANPDTAAIYDQMRQTVSPKEFSDEMLAGASQVDPEEVAKFKAELEQLDVPMEVLDMLNNMVDEILANPDNYEQVKQKYEAMGVTEDLLPAAFDGEFFSALNMAVDQMIAEPAGAQAFAKGGIAELSPISKAVASYGRNGDTMLAHITPAEARMLRRRGGAGTTNPKTGLKEYFSLGKLFKSIGNAVKSFASSTVGKVVTTVALGFFLGPAAASMVGATSAAGVAAVSGFVGSAGSTLLAGGNLKDALKAGAVGGLTAGAGAGVMGGSEAFASGSYTGPTTISGQVDKFTNMISPSAAAPAPAAAPSAIDASGNVKGLAPTDAPVFQSGQNLPQAQTFPVGDSMGAAAPLPGQPGSDVLVGGKPSITTLGTTQAPYSPLEMTGTPSKPFSEYFGTQPSAAAANPLDATQFQGSLAKPPVGVAPPTDPSFMDQAKDFYKNNFSPSGIQAQAEPLARQAATDAVAAAEKTIPASITGEARSAMLKTAYDSAFKAAMPGIVGTYGPMAAAGIGALALGGGFKPRDAAESTLKPELMKPVTQRIAEGGNQRNYYVQGLPGVKYDQYGAPIFGQYNPLPTFDTGLGVTSLLPKGYADGGIIGVGYAAGGAVTAASFDETAYLNANPDVKAELEKLQGSGSFKNAYEHYIQYGKAEGRTAFDKAQTAAKATADAAALLTTQAADRKAVADATAARKAAGFGNAYQNINAGLSYDVPAGIAASSIAARQAAFAPTMNKFTQAQTANAATLARPYTPRVVAQPYNNASGYGSVLNPAATPVTPPVTPPTAQGVPANTGEAAAQRQVAGSTPIARGEVHLGGGMFRTRDGTIVNSQGVPANTGAAAAAKPALLNMGGIASLRSGGYPRRTGQIDGPGTATSDSIPAMLSDGEFVMTAKAVRGAGKGDRRAGAKRMYALMNQLEKNAARG